MHSIATRDQCTTIQQVILEVQICVESLMNQLPKGLLLYCFSSHVDLVVWVNFEVVYFFKKLSENN